MRFLTFTLILILIALMLQGCLGAVLFRTLQFGAMTDSIKPVHKIEEERRKSAFDKIRKDLK